MQNYNPLPVEEKWQNFLEKEKIFRTKKNKDNSEQRQKIKLNFASTDTQKQKNI